MHIRIGFDITIACDVATPVLLALFPHPHEEARIESDDGVVIVPDQMPDIFFDEFGNRRARIVARPGETTFHFDAIAYDSGEPDAVAPDARQHAIEELPFDALRFLQPSRYCESDLLADEAWTRFGAIEGGWARVQAICDFVHEHIAFGYQHARKDRTALEAFREGKGVCRDFAHLVVAFCRAMNIPARYATGYLGDIGVPPAGPGDFSAWVDVFVGGRWHTVDARHNVPRIGRIVMARGRDAGDVPIIASFGATRLLRFEVVTDQVVEETAEMGAGFAFADEDDLEPLFRPAVVPSPAIAGTAGVPIMMSSSMGGGSA